MGILDKLRPQARWKHGDPTVRLEALAALGDDDRDVIGQMATDDADARVRRAAIARLADSTALAAVARNDSDDGVRDAAVSRLIAMATAGEDVTGAVSALGALGRQRDLATLARSSAPDAARHAAVAQLSDTKALAGVARSAPDAGTRLLALERLTDPSDLEGIALHGEYSDAAVAAVDRLPSPSDEQLAGISQRAKTKPAAKRAKALLAAKAPALPAPSAPAVAYRDADQESARALCTRMEALGADADMAAVRDGYATTRVAWVELLADVDIEPTLVAQFEALSDRVRERVAADEAVRADEARRTAALRQEQADRIAACERVEALTSDIEAGLATARDAWAAMPAMPDTWGGELQRRFDDACRAAERRLEQATRTADLIAKAPQVVEELEGLVAADYASVRGQVQGLRRRWQAIGRVSQVDPALAARFDAAAAVFDAREQEAKAGREHQQEENLHRLQKVVQELEARVAAESLSLKDANDIIKDVKLAVGTMGPLPTPQHRDDLTVRLQAVRSAVQPRLDELRNAEEWKRWANVQVQEDLCTKMEALVAIAEAEPEKAATEMRALQEKWKPVAAAPRSQAESLWTRFKAAQGAVYEKCKDFFAQQAAERQDALKKKEVLCERAEALKDSTDWAKTAEAMKVLQAEWKAIGPVTRGREKAVWERFRKACDTFFTRRQADLKQRKQDWGANLARKEALIAEAEQLAQSNEWDKAAARLKALQVEWKTVGPVKKSKSDQVWEKFRAACDLFFERFKHRDQAAIQTKFVDRDTAVAEIEALVPADGEPMPEGLFDKVQAARARWLQGPELPRHVLSPLAERVNGALLTLVSRWPEAFTGGDLDPVATAKRMEKLCVKVEGLAPAGASTEGKSDAPLSPAELLAKQWREALAANTMGAGAARQAEEARQRAADQELRSAQAAWLRLGPVPPDVRKPLQDRFERAVKRVLEGRRRHPARA